MHEHNRFSLLATSQNLFYQIQDADAPFYSFFRIRHLKKLTFEETMKFLTIQTQLENNKQLDKAIHTAEFKGKVRAIYQLTGGNHRLLVIFFGFLKAELKSDLSKIFVKTMNDLKPYYEQFLNALSPQQQKIINYLSSAHTPKMGKEISRFCFIAPNTLSKQTSELVEKGYLDKNKVGKDAYYELKEALMRICFEITDRADGTAKLFIDFLSVLYSERDLKRQYLKFRFFANQYDGDLKEIYQQEAFFYSKTLAPAILNELNSYTMPYWKKKEELEEKVDNMVKESNLNIEKQIIHFNKQGSDAFKNKNYDKAISFFNNAIRLNSNFSVGYFNIGLTLAHQKKYEEALIAFQKAISIKPDYANAHLNLGHTLIQLTREEEAITSFKKALDFNLDNSLLRYGLGFAYCQLGKFKVAINEFNLALEKNPSYVPAYIEKGLIYKKQRKYQEALINYQKVIEIDPQNIFAHIMAGVSYGLLRNYDLSYQSYNKALELNPKEPLAYNGIGMNLLRQGKYTQGLSILKKGLSFDKKNWYTNGTILGIYLSMNDIKKGKLQFKKSYNISNKYIRRFYILLEEDVLFNLFKNTNFHIAKEFLDFLILELRKKHILPELWKALPNAIFEVLINIEDYSEKRLEGILQLVKEVFQVHKEATIPLLYLDIGIRYLKKNDKRAIYDLSKEERQIFKEFVLDKRVSSPK